jgi:hypothetical protein
MMNSVDETHWQETLAETLEGVPEEHKQKVSGFLIGYLAALKEEVNTHEEHQV